MVPGQVAVRVAAPGHPRQELQIAAGEVDRALAQRRRRRHPLHPYLRRHQHGHAEGERQQQARRPLAQEPPGIAPLQRPGRGHAGQQEQQRHLPQADRAQQCLGGREGAPASFICQDWPSNRRAVWNGISSSTARARRLSTSWRRPPDGIPSILMPGDCRPLYLGIKTNGRDGFGLQRGEFAVLAALRRSGRPFLSGLAPDERRMLRRRLAGR